MQYLFLLLEVVFANGLDAAFAAFRASCRAYIPSVKYQPVVRLVNILFGYMTDQLFFCRQGRFGIGGQPYSRTHPEHVGVHCHIGLLIDY